MTVLELTVAVAMLGVLLASTVKMMFVVADQQRAADRRIVALQTAQAVCDEVCNTPWQQLTSEAANRLPMPAAAQTLLPDAKLKVDVNEEASPPAKRISVELTWKDKQNRSARPVRITAWTFPETAAN